MPGKRALLMGWVHRRRDHGGVVFVNLRDREGVTQIVFHADADPALHNKADLPGSEYVIAVEGVVTPRTKETINPALPTGEVEVVVEKLWILNASRTPPFPMEETVDVKEDARLKYRYVDLRRPHMQRNIILRSKIAFAVRETLTSMGFLEIETPFMTRSTPEGARDYLVPSRVNPGNFLRAAAIAADLQAAPDGLRDSRNISRSCAVSATKICARTGSPNSPRSISKCPFRNRDRARSDRALMRPACKAVGFDTAEPFPRLTYAQAMRCYGSDKPDLRIPPFYCVEDLFAAQN